MEDGHAAVNMDWSGKVYVSGIARAWNMAVGRCCA